LVTLSTTPPRFTTSTFPVSRPPSRSIASIAARTSCSRAFFASPPASAFALARVVPRRFVARAPRRARVVVVVVVVVVAAPRRAIVAVVAIVVVVCRRGRAGG
jgi:hypothetical protein